jgi:inorganic pyrophosphatase
MKKRTSGKRTGSPLKENVIDVVIETPKGSRNKFKYDVHSRRFKLAKVLPEGMVFPFDFGFVPSTKGADGDPLDVLVLMDEPAFPGCFVECRLVGILEAEQTKGQRKIRNDRLIAVANQSLLYSDILHLSDLNGASVVNCW